MYNVKLQNFEGPFDLLHQLIESEKLEITEISLAQVANQFLDHIKSGVAAEELANFLVVAGRLALIKSRALLPFLELTKDEESDIESLKEQLAEYYKYRNLAKEIRKLDISRNIFYSRMFLAGVKPVFYFPKKLTSEKLANSLQNILSTVTLPQRIPQAQFKSSISIDEKLEEIRKLIKDKIELKFSDILKSESLEEKVAVFIGVLELSKRSELDAEQEKNFGEITLINNKLQITNFKQIPNTKQFTIPNKMPNVKNK